MSTSSTIDAPSQSPAERPLKLPKAQPAASAPLDPALQQPAPPTSENMRNPMFELLVRNETDVAGLLAYSLYKQNKRDWLIAFQKGHGRPPTEEETEAFILGERIDRRTATYRLLAEEMLRGSEAAKPTRRETPVQPAPAASAARPATQPMAAPPPAKSAIPWRQLGLLLLALVAMAILFRYLGGWLFSR